MTLTVLPPRGGVCVSSWIWWAYKQEKWHCVIPGLCNKRQTTSACFSCIFFLPWNPAIRAIRKPKQPREASCRCWANRTSWGCNQQPASLLRHENKGKKPSDDFSLQTSCVPDEAQNSSEKKRAVPTGLFLDACSLESKNMIKCFLCHKCGLLWRLDRIVGRGNGGVSLCGSCRRRNCS